MKLVQLNKFLTFFLFCRFFHSSVTAQMSNFILYKSQKEELAKENHSDISGHGISAGEKILKEFSLKLVR